MLLNAINAAPLMTPRLPVRLDDGWWKQQQQQSNVKVQQYDHF